VVTIGVVVRPSDNRSIGPYEDLSIPYSLFSPFGGNSGRSTFQAELLHNRIGKLPWNRYTWLRIFVTTHSDIGAFETAPDSPSSTTGSPLAGLRLTIRRHHLLILSFLAFQNRASFGLCDLWYGHCIAFVLARTCGVPTQRSQKD
jgi:hypothetical protein